MTLQDAIESGQYSQQTDEALSEFLDWLVKSDIVARDVHLTTSLWTRRTARSS
ncbi:hypothetical protein [Agrobacterium sp. SORGH_AS 787]|uniref:hypothetical protein n=1 Tax=Agrobacterium sp. SORGH_AS 787 TaxID=3041775 RepID=UPI0027806BE6|nr:hypothetical protein [Rhizobium sp. SORGH_AS_0787]